MGKNPFDMDPDVQAMRGSGGTAPVRWGRVFSGVLVVACLTLAFAFYLPLQRAHATLTNQYSELQSQVESGNRSLEEARGQVKTLTEKRETLESELKERDDAAKAKSEAGKGLRSSIESKLGKQISKDQAAVGTSGAQVIAALAVDHLLLRGKLDVSPAGSASLCSVAESSGKKTMRALAVVGSTVPAALAAKLKTPLEYSTALAAQVAATLVDKCNVDAARVSATGFAADPPAPTDFDGKKLSKPRVEIWIDASK